MNSRRYISSYNSKGYLLFEVLLSLTILSAGLILISSSILSSIYASKLVKDHYQAVMLLERKITQIESEEIEVPEVPGEVLEGEEYGYYWELEEEPPNYENYSSTFYKEITVRVRWKEKGREQEVDATIGISQ